MSAAERPVAPAAKAVSLLLALLPPLRMAWIVFTVGENNLSNDYLIRMPLIASMLDGSCSPAKFFREAWVAAGHSLIAVAPIYWASARLISWDVRGELSLGLLATAGALVVIVWTLRERDRWVLLPILSLLLFSTARISALTFGESAVQMGLSQLGVAMAALALGRGGHRPLGAAAWAACGGVIASWSWGGGVMVWPVLFAAFVLRRERRIQAWVILTAGACLGLAQYLVLLHPGVQEQHASPLAKARLFLDLLGRPFVNGTRDMGPRATSQLVGGAGLLVAVLLVVMLRSRLRERAGALLLVGWSGLVAAQIAAFRGDVTPWYISSMTIFWVGLVSLMTALRTPSFLAGVALVALLALRVQRTWEDKSFYLESRSPASASCLREWRTHAVPCHARLFQWGGPNLAEGEMLGEPLERRRLSVFSNRRTYLLQGDLAVGRVDLQPAGGAFFTRNGRTPGDPGDFRRLDLVLAPGASAIWRVDLPPHLVRARFVTRVRASADDATIERAARVSIAGEAAGTRALVVAGRGELLSFDLAPWAGKAVVIELTAEGAAPGAPLVFDAPKVDLSLAR